MKNIYIDLDNTLVNACACRKEEYDRREDYPKSRFIGLEWGHAKNIEYYDVICRKGAHTVLEKLRNYNNVKLFTNSVRAYAWAINEQWKLGFKKEEIIAREDYVHKPDKMDVYAINLVSAYGRDPNAILIDDMTWIQYRLQEKAQFLGLTNKDQLITVPRFEYNMENDLLEYVWCHTIYNKLESLGRKYDIDEA